APVDAEQALLGFALSGRQLDDLAVEPGDFFQPWHGEVWRACQTLHDRGERPHPIMVRRMLEDVPCPHSDLGVALVELVEQATGRPDHYATLVTDAADRRRLADVGTKLQQLASSDRDPSELAEIAVGLLTAPS